MSRPGKNAVLVLLAAAGVAGVVVLRISPVFNVPKWDEFIYVYDAQRILDGQVPYRDFFQFTPPADLLALAGWFKLLGGKATLTLGRYLATLLALAGWGWTARALRRAGWPGRWPAALAALYPLVLYPFWAVPSHHWMAALLLPASLEAYDFQRGAVKGLAGWGWIGACVGLAVLTLQTALATLLAFWGVAWLSQKEHRAPSAGTAAAGSVLALAPLCLWLATRGAFPAFLRDVFLWPGSHYARAGGVNSVRLLQDLPERIAALWQAPTGAHAWLWVPPALAGTLVFLGILLLALALVALFVRWLFQSMGRRSLGEGLQAPAAACAAITAALYLMGKTDWLHLLYQLLPAGLAWLVAFPPAQNAKLRKGWGAALAALLACAFLYQAGRLLFHVPKTWEFADVDRPVREAPVNAYLRAQDWLPPGARIAAFPEGGEVYLYTRPAAVSYTLLYPPDDRYHDEEDYRRVAREILERRPKAVVLTLDAASAFLNDPCPLARPLKERYQAFATVDGAVILRRREEP